MPEKKDLISFEFGERWRNNVRAYILDRKNSLLLVQIPEHIGPKWELVGGGIKEHETPIEALKREVFEEVGFENYEVILRIDKPSYERFDTEVIKKFDFDFIGLKIIRFVVKLDSNEPPIRSDSSEVGLFQWVDLSEAETYLTFRGQQNCLKEVILNLA